VSPELLLDTEAFFPLLLGVRIFSDRRSFPPFFELRGREYDNTATDPDNFQTSFFFSYGFISSFFC